MKKGLSIFLSFVMMLSVTFGMNMIVNADTSGSCGESMAWRVTDDGVLEISGFGDIYDYYGEDENDTSAPWFDLCESITSIVINEGVESIGACAFSALEYVTDVSLPSTLVSICDLAFAYDYLLTQIDIGENVETIGDYAFLYCESLQELTFSGDCLVSIGDSAFLNSGITGSVVIPDSVISIGASAFSGCSSLTYVELPSNLQTIEKYTFKGCSSLTEITVPSSVEAIGIYAFAHNSSLTKAYISDGVKTIGNYAFAYDQKLKGVYIGDGVESIGNYAFYNDSALESIFIPASVTEISSTAFNSVSSDMTVYIYRDSYADEYFSEKDYNIVYVEEDGSLYVTVTLDANGGECSYDSISRKYSGEYGTLPTPTRSGYTFDGWYTEADGGDVISSTDIVSSYNPFTIYAHWTANTYIIKFSTEGTLNFPQIEVTYGQPIGELPTVTKTGFTFVGWFTTPASDKTLSVMLTSDTIYDIPNDSMAYGRWVYDDYIINFYDGDTLIDSQQLYYTNNNTLTTAEDLGLTDGGYEFLGWAVEEDSTDIAFADGDAISTSDIENGELNLYAVWQAKQITVYFDYNGADSNITTESMVVTYGETYANLPTPPVRNGYLFTGWYNSSNKKILNTTVVTETEDITLTAHWNAIVTYTVTFYYNDSTSKYTTKSYTGNIEYGSLPTVTRTDYTFEGWYTQAEGGTQVVETDIVTSSTSLYAHWSNGLVTVTFDANGGMLDYDTEEYTQGEEYGYLPIPERDGYTFDGWYIDGDTLVEDTDIADEDVTLIAKWTPIELTVTYDAMGGTCSTETGTVTYGEAMGELPTPTMDGYTFTGWYTSSLYSTLVDSDTVVLQTEDFTLYACWSQDSTEDPEPTDPTDPTDPSDPTESTAVITVSDAVAKAGSEVEITVSISENPGITSIRLIADFDTSVLTMTGVEFGDAASSMNTGTSQYYGSPYSVSMYSAVDDITDEGVLVTFTFTVNEDAESGTYPVNITYDADDIFNLAGDSITLEVINGEIEVYSYILGDLNGDGKVNMRDVVLLQQVINGWDVEYDSDAADYNEDGKVNMRDLVALQQYING